MIEEKPKILYVDDEDNNLIVFKSSFRRYYDVYTATSAPEGLKITQENDISVIITDQRMPGMTGIEFLKQLPEDLLAIRMILTGFSDVSAIIEAINSGKVYRYITKPWDKDELKMTIDNALDALKLKKSNQELVKELKEINEQLEQKVIERTSELEKALEEINHQKGELEELNATKDKFFSIIAHDLRSPISALAGFSEMLANNGKHLSPEKVTEYSTELNKSIKNALTLIENLLTWASSQMNKIHHDPSDVNISELTESIISQLSTAASNKKINLEKDLTPGLKVYADQDHLKLVLRNLISNAIKFTEENGKVTVSTKSVSPSKVEITVADSGIGMSLEKLTTLFNVGDTQSTKGTAGEKGTGLGLILSKEFVEKNNGSIEVASLKGMGTTFTVTLDQPA